jgi:O-Antigen ligase
VSSLVTAPERDASGPAPAAARQRAPRIGLSSDATLGLGLAAGFALLAFTTTGGVDLAPSTWAEIVLTLLGAAVCAAVVLFGAPGRAWGGVSVSLFAALAVLTAVSITWSVQPDDSWQGANQALAYLAAFAGAVALARLAPGRWRALVGALAVLATVLSGYALLVKVFPGTLDAGDTLGRLQAPFGYWNVTGLIAALGLPPCLWAGARRDRGRALRALTVPAVGLLISVIVLSYSRSAVLVALIGLGIWLAIVPLRLRAVLVLGLGAAGGAVIAVWALVTHPLTSDNIPLAARTTAGHGFGVVLILTLALLTAAGFAAAFAMDRVAVAARVRHRVGIALVILVALVPVGGVVATGASSRGLTGEVSHVWSTLINPNATVGDTPGRLVELGNSRARYWREGVTVGQHALLKGVGALGYGTARTRYTTDPWIVQHAHSYEIETFADFGLIGVALGLALLIAWSIAAGRAVGFRTKWSSLDPEQAAERCGLTTLLVVVIMFGVQSSTDWTWFIPGVAIPPLICAGWLAGRGPLACAVGRTRQRKPLTQRPGAGALVTGLAALALLGAWVIWQPLRSADADAAATSALIRGNTRAALADARTAAATDPLSVEPLFELSALYTTIDPAAAHAELLKAVRRQPQNAQTWLQLGEYYVQTHQPRQAIAALSQAHRFDLSSQAALTALAQAESQLPASR